MAVEPQAILTPITEAAIFLTLVVDRGAEAQVRDLLPDVGGLRRSVGFRAPEAGLTCVTGVGAGLWDRLFGVARPAGLHPFREIRSGGRHAVSTPGDILFHLRAERMDLCFELATHITTRLGSAVSPADDVHGFRYFDDRDLIGFVDGTENPDGADAVNATVIGAEEPDFAGGSYVIVQKYLHDLDGWNRLSTEEQEGIIGRTKLSDIELTDDVKPSYAHNALTSIEEDGEEIDIIRDNMPFGSPSRGEFGTYFIGYTRRLWVIERMLKRMFIGDPPGLPDRILDFSTAVTGGTFFVPPLHLLEALGPSADSKGTAP